MADLIKRNRKGLTRAKWTELFTAVLKLVGIEKPEIKFEDGEIWITDSYSIAPHDWTEDNVLHRGYLLTQWVGTSGTYHEPPDVYDREVGTFDTPYQIAAEIAKSFFGENLNGLLEGFEMDDQAEAEKKWEKELDEFYQEQMKEQEEVQIDHAADERYSDFIERHNKQVLSRL